ncbi:MAG: YcxB family protein [Gammaproteobacteria bacterium]|nr:YcxB family protein [Gammaproteobacteria bacterium]MDH5652482.1 YcxB family protein [Gammaproteobacteria bacterium]
MEISANISRLDLFKMQYILLFKLRANYFFIALLYLVAGLASFKLLAAGDVAVWVWTWLLIGSVIFLITFNLIIFIQLVSATAEKGWIGETLFRLEDESFYEKTAGTETRTRWQAIIQVYRTKNFILVRINAYRIHIIPKRAFANDNEFEKFYNRLVEKVKNAKQAS